MAARKSPAEGRKGDKLWRDALMLAVNDKDKQGRKMLRLIAEKTVQAAVDGDMAAVREIADRLDGKAVQPTETKLTGDLTVNVVTGLGNADG